MKKIISALLILLLCVCTASCSILPEPSSYKALSCEAGGFSFLYHKDFSATADKNTATIYIDDEGELPMIVISVIYNGDTEGFDPTEYFFYRAEDMQSLDNIRYTLFEPFSQRRQGSATVSSATYTFSLNGETVYRREALLDTHKQLVSYSCYYYEGESEDPIAAMEDAIRSFQPSADYYQSHSVELDNPQAQTPSTLCGYDVKVAQPLISGLVLYDGGFFSVMLPAGWKIQTMGQYNTFAFRAWNPQNPDFEIFYYSSLNPFNKTSAAKSWNRSNSGYGFPYNIYGDAPVVSPKKVAQLFYVWNDFARLVAKYTGVAYQSGFSFPQLNNFKLIESIPVSTYFSNIASSEALVRGSFTSAQGTACTGKFCGSLYSVGTYYLGGVDMLPLGALSVSGVLAPQESFYEVEQVLSAAIYSLNFTDEYVQQAQAYIKKTAEGYMAANASLQATYSSYNSAWSSRQTSYDVISQKTSDATLGYDRLYDPDTGEVYRAELGFYDSYDLHRDEYSNANLQIIDGSSESYYLQGVDYYITK